MLRLTDSQIHAARIVAANWCNASRQILAASPFLRRDEEQALRDHGIAVVSDFLPRHAFEKIRSEATEAMVKAEQETPVRERKERGFGAQEKHPWGFDRYDGGTLNRFVDIDPEIMPSINEFSRHIGISRLCRVGLGMTSPPRRPKIYLTVHGNEKSNHDIQKDFHRDSCFRKIKYWYFLDPVEEDCGPFNYVRGSHKLTPRRLEWERRQAQKRGIKSLMADPSFRVTAAELASMDLPQPQAIPVPENTLVLADTFGFHRRGDAKTDTRRLAIYGQKKPWPFAPVGI
jgi:hypothetical protein